MKAAVWSSLLVVAACQPPTFEAPSRVDSVRILANKTDTPYARPGETVKVTSLALDARPSQLEPMRVYWLPGACINPPGDAYYQCFAGLANELPRGVDLGPLLTEGDSFSFRMPEDVIESHPTREGQEPYGLAVVFTIACAGHVEYAPPAPGGSPDAVPFACFDRAGSRLGAEDFVFAYSLVYAFADRRNENPVLERVTYGGAPIDPEQGLRIPRCQRSNIDDCGATKLDVSIPSLSHEPDPSNLDTNGSQLRETLYVRYFSTGGKISNDTVVIFDPRKGRLSDTGDEFRAQQLAGEYRLWAVVHDNRGGVTWLELPLHVE